MSFLQYVGASLVFWFLGLAATVKSPNRIEWLHSVPDAGMAGFLKVDAKSIRLKRGPEIGPRLHRT
jgi:hypothetical protein